MLKKNVARRKGLIAMAKRKVKKRLIVLLSLLTTFITAVVLFCAITGFNIKTFIFGTSATGNAVITDTDLETTTLEPPSDGSTPDSYDALTNFAYFAYKLEHSDFEATTDGKASAKYNGMNVDQNVYDYRLKSGDYILTDTRSTSTFVKVYQEQFFTGEKVLYRAGSSSNYDSMTVNARSNSQEFALYGLGPEKIIGYIVCKDTLLSDTGVVSNGDGTYTTTYSLDPTVAPVYYQRKVKTNATISDMPNFVSVDLTYTYDSNWNVISATYNEVYSIYKMKSWIETSTDITETFTYLSSDEAQSKINDKYNFYKDYFDMEVPADDEIISDTTEMTALDYLGTMASLMNEDYINANVEVAINGKKYECLAKISPKDLSASILVDDINIIYKDNKLYIKGDTSGYYDINELLSLFNLQANTATSLDTEDLISGIMSDINNGSVSHSGDYTYVDITFNLFGYSIPTTFTFYTPDEDTIEFTSLGAAYTYNADEFELCFSLLDSLDLSFDTDGLEAFTYAADVSLDATLSYNGYSFDVEGDIYLDLYNKVCDGAINITYDGTTITANITYKDNYIYIEALDKVYFKISIEEIKALMADGNTQALDTTGISYELVKSYLENISVSTSKSLDISYNNELVLKDLTISNISLSISPRSDYKDVVVDDSNYIDYTSIKPLINNIISKANEINEAEGLTATIDASYNDYKVQGTVYLKYDTLSLKAILNVSSTDFSTDLVLYYLNDEIYLEYNSLKISLTKNKLQELIPASNNESIDINEILNILNSIKYTTSLDILLNTSAYIGTDLSLSITDDLTLQIKSTAINATITNISGYSDVIELDSSAFVNVDSYVDDGLNIYDLIKDKSFTLTLSDVVVQSLGHEVLLAGEIYVNNKNLEADIYLNIDSKYDVDIALKLVSNKVYLTVSNQTFVLDLETMDSFIDEALAKINTMLGTSYTINEGSSLELQKILNVVSAITITDSINLNLTELLNKALTIAVVIKTTDNDANISFTSTGEVVSSGNITIINTEAHDILAPTSNLFDTDDILTLLDYISSAYALIDDKLFSLTINDLVLSKADAGDYFNISGSVKLNLIDGIKEFDAILSLIIIEYRNGLQYGWHQVNLTIISATTSGGTAMVYGTYGNNESDLSSVVKVYSTFDGVKALINSVMDLMQIDTFSNMLSDSSSQLLINSLINEITINDTDLTLVLDQQALNKYLSEQSLITLTLTKTNDRLSNIELTNAYLSYTNDRDYLKITSLDVTLEEITSLDVEAPSDTSDYIDLSNLSYLFEALYEDAQLEYFEITGTVKLVALGILTISVPVDIKIHVTESGEPEVLATLDIPSVILLLTKKTLTIAYKDGYVYLNRVDKESGSLLSSKKKNYFLKITYQEFMSDFLNYLLGEYGCGMPDQIMKLITSSSSDKGTPNAADCVNSATIGQTSFSFNLDLGEIVQDSNIGDMDVTLSTQEITNKSGELVNVLTTIDTFTLDMVSVITLSGSGLTLSNVSNGVVNDVDMQDLYSFVEAADSTYTIDTYYSGNNGSYSAGSTISHTLTYNYNGTEVEATYYYGDSVELPSSVTIDDVTYEVEAWYSDSTYQTKITEYSMPAYDKTLYAKLK